MTNSPLQASAFWAIVCKVRKKKAYNKLQKSVKLTKVLKCTLKLIGTVVNSIKYINKYSTSNGKSGNKV